jgi:gluconolactonase
MTSRWPDSPVLYPDPAVRVLDPRFAPYVIGSAAVERLTTGYRWTEGPVWFGDHQCLLFSDIPNDRIMRWDAQTGTVSTFRAPSCFANGGARDRHGRLVSCEHLTRRVTRTETDGRITVLADQVDGKPLNAPNDVVVSADGAVWFTDPGYGIESSYEGDTAEAELPRRVYRIAVEDGGLDVVVDSLERPKGLCFSPGESLLYVVDSGSSPATVHVSTACTCSLPTAPGSGRSSCRSSAPTCASAGDARTGSS